MAHPNFDCYTAIKLDSFIDDFKRFKATFDDSEIEFKKYKTELDQIKHKFEIIKDLRSDVLEIKGSNNLFKNSIEKSKQY